MTHILCGTDFTEGAGWAWQRAVLIASANDCALELLHVIENESAHVNQGRDEALARLAATGSERDLRVEVRVARGVPGDVLASEGAKNGCRLVVLGPRSKKDFITWLLGSTAERVIRRCRTPVLAVHQPAKRAYGRALASLDFESASREALEAALRLKLVPDGGLAVAHAFFAPLRRAVGLADISIKTEEEHVQEVGNEALATAIGIVSALGLDGLRVSTFISEGEAWQVIADAAERWSADLLVMGSHGRGPVAEFFLGSTATAALRRATCDVLVKRA